MSSHNHKTTVVINNKKYFKCGLCDSLVSHSEKSWEQHEDGKTHQKNTSNNGKKKKQILKIKKKTENQIKKINIRLEKLQLDNTTLKKDNTRLKFKITKLQKKTTELEEAQKKCIVIKQKTPYAYGECIKASTKIQALVRGKQARDKHPIRNYKDINLELENITKFLMGDKLYWNGDSFVNELDILEDVEYNDEEFATALKELTSLTETN